jgi:hypothetical protein
MHLDLVFALIILASAVIQIDRAVRRYDNARPTPGGQHFQSFTVGHRRDSAR